ncbi:Crp/Fnr family transcriptional regulator [Adhaeribacter swui]|uniref:Crp/Fnr family transcriptional regulator n=1 Tax=Adhaeribacter swui TaxID=2086471 RepID=A0A7G7GAN5_9BACT|nr:Crp/Fnr family transcriptional regulator [Adhaeribacter swui]QNF34219.1 Crp/Fnr family transcriptional regulator [Adhaeribacter swui]
MIRASFIDYAIRLSPLDAPAMAALQNNLVTKSVLKGDYLLRDGEVCKHLYFINEGLTKTFFLKEDKEFIMRFFPEYSMFTVLDSFLTQTPSLYSIIALEDTSLTFISHTHLEELCNKHHRIETFFRKLVSVASINMMKRISEMLEENGTKSYNHFLSENKQLLQRISLGDLASYLGITQVSLSRIRAKK